MRGAWIWGIVFALALPVLAAVRVPAVIGDNMVLQRDRALPIWGWADPGERVQVVFHGQRREAVTDPNGRWQVTLAPMPAGGPFEMRITGASAIILHNILLGEVWVCSGQSNMNVPVAQWCANWEQEVAAADYPQIRLFNVANVLDAKPRADVYGGWSRCTPASVAGFSATGYFFGRELYKALHVPVGLIHASWGGTPIESWMSYEALTAEPSTRAAAQKLQTQVTDYDRLYAAYTESRLAWEKNNPRHDPGNAGVGQGWAAPETDATTWKTIEQPRAWQTVPELAGNAIIWARKEVDIPAAWAGQELRLSLGPLDDMDTTYFNGAVVGGIGAEATPWYWITPRIYTVPGKLVKAGKNLIATRIVDHGGGGGFMGQADQLLLAPTRLAGVEPIGLSGTWQYKVESVFTQPPGGEAPYPPIVGGNPSTPACLFNGKIAGLIPFGARGAVWYQGEANANNGYQYRALLARLADDWRQRWGAPFSFLVVQLPNYGPVAAAPGDSAWAELREAQFRAGQLPGNGTSVNIDIGEAGNIHPKNKQEVGRRLALLALGRAYGQQVEYSGPVYTAMRREGNGIRLTFAHLGGGLCCHGEALKGFTIAGDDRKFVWAEAKIDGDTVVVHAEGIANPTAVRYAWADNPACNLYNKAGLPAAPFRTDDWPGLSWPKP